MRYDLIDTDEEKRRFLDQTFYSVTHFPPCLHGSGEIRPRGWWSVDKCCSDDVLVKNDMSVIVYYDVDETFLFDNEHEMDEFLFELIKKGNCDTICRFGRWFYKAESERYF